MDDRHCTQVMEGIWNQKKQQRLCDTILRPDDGMILAHRCVLCANSSYFNSVLFSNVAEGSVEEVVLSGYSAAFIDSVVDYMYTGEIHVSPDTLVDILTFGDKYGIDGLKRLCKKTARTIVNSTNWIDLLKLTVSTNLADLVGAITDFMVEVDDSYLLECQDILLLSAEEIGFLLSSHEKNKVTNEGAMQLLKLVLAWTSYSFQERQQYLQNLIGALCITRLSYTMMKSFLTKVPEELRLDEEVVALLNALESNETSVKYEIIPEMDQDTCGYSDNTDIISDVEDGTVELGEEKEKPPPNKHKRKSVTPMRHDVEEDICLATPSVPVKSKQNGRAKTRKPASLQTKILVRPKLLLSQSKKLPIVQDYVPTGNVEKRKRKPRKPRPKKARKEVTEVEREVFKCPRCEERYTNRITFRHHMRQHADTSPFTCDKCDFQTKHYGMYLSHKRRKHKEGDAMIQCPKCPKTFASESACGHHLRGHGTDIPLLCDICGFTTKHHATMNLHKRIHQGKVFKCHYEGCTYEAVRKNRYLDHLSGHEGMKNHICAVCGKAFIARKHLLRHENIHRGDPIRCELCDYTTSRNDKLRQHMRVRHPDVALERGYCTQAQAYKQLSIIAATAAKPISNRTPKHSSKKKSRQNNLTTQEETSRATQAIVITPGEEVIEEKEMLVHTSSGPGLQIQGPAVVGTINEEMLNYLSTHHSNWQYQAN